MKKRKEEVFSTYVSNNRYTIIERADEMRSAVENVHDKMSYPKMISSYYHQNNNFNHLRKLYQF